jgi:hypothetical protein
MQRANIGRIFVIAGILALFISYAGIWMRFISDPVQRTGSDFIAFYSAGRVAKDYGTANVYDPLLQQQVQQKEVGFPLVEGQVLLYNHLPFLIPILQLIANSSYVYSFHRWVVFLIVIYSTAIALLSHLLRLSGVEQTSTHLTAISSVLFFPIFFSLMNGQDTAFLLLGAAIWVFGLGSDNKLISGLGLSLTSVRPHIAIVLAIPMLFHYRKTFWGFVLGSGILALLSIIIIRIEGIEKYAHILSLTAGGQWYGMKEYAMFNLIGALLRLFPWIAADTIRTIGWIIYGLTIIGLCILWARTRDPRHGLIGLTVTLALFVAPHLHFHDLALLLIPIYELIRDSGEAGGLKTSIAILLPIAISLLMLISNISPYLQYTVPYLVMLVLAGYPYRARFRTPLTTPHRS